MRVRGGIYCEGWKDAASSERGETEIIVSPSEVRNKLFFGIYKAQTTPIGANPLQKVLLKTFRAPPINPP